MFFIIAGIVAYLFLGGVVGGICRSLFEKHCTDCKDGRYCADTVDHNLWSIAYGTFWPIASIVLIAASLGDYIVRLPEIRAERAKIAAQAAAEKQKQIDRFLESQGVKIDWTKL